MHPKLNTLNPKVQAVFAQLHDALISAHKAGETETLFEPFEGFRFPATQAKLVTAGTSKAGPWQSAHNYGLAVDFVARLQPDGSNPLPGTVLTAGAKWSWLDTHDWPFLKKTSERFGLSVPIKWDRCHVEHPLWRTIRRFVI